VIVSLSFGAYAVTVTKAGGLLKMGGSLAAGRAGECTPKQLVILQEEYVKGDPFLLNGMMSAWYTHKWSNMFA
jgi:hypothetical protein